MKAYLTIIHFEEASWGEGFAADDVALSIVLNGAFAVGVTR